MLDIRHYVVFLLDEQPYGVGLSTVTRAIRAVEITPLPQAPAIVMGIINLEGRIIPVVNIRRRFRLPERELALTDQFIIARASRSAADAENGRLLALVADRILGVRELSAQETAAADTILPGLEYLEGVAKTELGMVLIHDLRSFLSLEEEKALGAILPGVEEHVV